MQVYIPQFTFTLNMMVSSKLENHDSQNQFLILNLLNFKYFASFENYCKTLDSIFTAEKVNC